MNGSERLWWPCKDLPWKHGERHEEEGISGRRTSIIVDTGNYDMFGDKIIDMV